jgi:hypothetical protein
MNVKKTYEIGDTVWIYGVNRSNKITQGKIVYQFTLKEIEDMLYVISIPTHIESLFEVRSWQTISQDEIGPVGAFREMIAPSEADAIIKKMSHGGYEYDLDYDPPDPSPAEIEAALKRSQEVNVHPPLVLKEAKKRSNRRFVPRKKKSQ